MLYASNNTCNIDLFPFDWDILCLKDGLDTLSDFRTDTITCRTVLATCMVEAAEFTIDDIPGISVTVYFPPNLVGLKMPDEALAIAIHHRN